MEALVIIAMLGAFAGLWLGAAVGGIGLIIGADMVTGEALFGYALVGSIVAPVLFGALHLLFSQPSNPHLGPRKGGVNDLSRWEPWGGPLKRPPPPAPMNFVPSSQGAHPKTPPPAPRKR